MQYLLGAASAALLLGTTVVQAQQVTIQNSDRTVTLSGGVGILAIESREYVFAGAGSSDYMSLLIWQSMAPTLSTSLDVELPGNWSLGIDAAFAIAGDSYMEDYDWLAPFAVGTPDMSNWTDQSKHPNTNLDWYFNGSVTAAYNIELEAGPVIQLHGGVEYTDVQWTANGGTYTYSAGGFRDDIGAFGPGRGITYRQQFPTLVTGANARFSQGNWNFDLGAKVGLTFSSRATDDHWLRDTRFVEEVFTAPLVGVSASASRQLSNNLNFVISGKADRIFLGRSNTSMFDIPTGAPSGSSLNASGADLLSGALNVGLKGSF